MERTSCAASARRSRYDGYGLKDHIARAGLLALALAALFCVGASAQCPRGDVNGDCRVDHRDLALLASQWLTDPNATVDPNTLIDPNEPADPNDWTEPCQSADVNGDLWVNLLDLTIVAEHWGRVECPIVINELLAHSHSIDPDWIELHNVSTVPVDIGNWTLSDDQGDLQKYRIAEGTIIGPGDYLLLYEDLHFGNAADPGAVKPFRMSENGEALYLYSGDDALFPHVLLGEVFGASETGISFGRYRKSTGSFAFILMSENTPGRANAYPQVGPVVINEIMYRPAADGDAEYIELLNISDGPVTLFDFNSLEPWRFIDVAGIAFSFPTDTPVTLQPREYLLLARDLSEVRRYYNVPNDVQAFEWGSGRLSNSGETITLLKPGDVDESGIRYWVEVDVVSYSDGSHGEDFEGGLDPWPTEPDGLGPSLNRMFWSRYGNDPNNWQATIPTPGSTND